MSPPLSDTVVGDTETAPPKKRLNWLLIIVYGTLTGAGVIGGPLLQRLYFLHGGNSKWLSALLQAIGFLTLLPPITFLFFRGRSSRKLTPDLGFFMDPKFLASSAIIGVMAGLISFFYSAGLSSLPVSTASLLFSTQLAFVAFFARLIVKQKFTFYSLNAVMVIILGAVVLGLHASNDRPAGETNKKYLLGFIFTLLGAITQGVMLPFCELAYLKSTKPMDYMMVFQFQFVMNLVSSLVMIIGLFGSKEYKFISKEAAEFGLGQTMYVVIMVASVLVWQLASLGSMGLISCTSALFSGIFSAVLLPLSEVGAVIAFGEKFDGSKGLSLALCLWGFTSYFVGEYRKTAKTEPEVELSKV